MSLPVVPLLPQESQDHSTAGKQARLVDRVQKQTKMMLDSQAVWIGILWNMIWKNPEGLTPQQSFDSFGASAVTIRTKLNGAITNINAFRAGSVNLSEPKSVTNNNDGSVTVSA